jgi:hypothetical protein
MKKSYEILDKVVKTGNVTVETITAQMLPHKRTIFINKETFRLNFPTTLFYLTRRIDSRQTSSKSLVLSVFFLESPISKEEFKFKKLYIPPFPNMAFDWGGGCVCLKLKNKENLEDALDEAIKDYFTTSFGGDDVFIRWRTLDNWKDSGVVDFLKLESIDNM